MKKTFLTMSAIILSVALLTGCRLTQAPSVQNLPDTSQFIGEERAKEIALEKAGITDDGVVFEKVELDRDNGVWKYEVDFRKDRTEYDADIKADDGMVISFETDYND